MMYRIFAYGRIFAYTNDRGIAVRLARRLDGKLHMNVFGSWQTVLV